MYRLRDRGNFAAFPNFTPESYLRCGQIWKRLYQGFSLRTFVQDPFLSAWVHLNWQSRDFGAPFTRAAPIPSRAKCRGSATVIRSLEIESRMPPDNPQHPKKKVKA